MPASPGAGDRRTRAFGETLFGEPTALAVRRGAADRGQGAPDSAPPDFGLRAGRAAVEAPERPYARDRRRPFPARALTERMAPSLAPSRGRELDPATEILVTRGAAAERLASLA